MIDNRSILVLAVDTVEKIEQVLGETTIDQERVLPIIEGALQEAFRRGFQDCLGKKVQIKSEDEGGKRTD